MQQNANLRMAGCTINKVKMKVKDSKACPTEAPFSNAIASISLLLWEKVAKPDEAGEGPGMRVLLKECIPDSVQFSHDVPGVVSTNPGFFCAIRQMGYFWHLPQGRFTGARRPIITRFYGYTPCCDSYTQL